MSWYEEDFYYEPSEFEIQINEFKNSLMQSVKEEFITQMEQLKKENAELQEVKANFEKIKNEYREKEQKLERERSELERKVRRERLSTLIKDFEVIMYRAYSKSELPPKCDKCNEKRKIEYTTPLGKTAYESCECSIGKTVFYPEEYICTEFKLNDRNDGMKAWYKMNRERDYDYGSYESSTFARTIYNSDLKFDDLDRWETFFKTKDECQVYCDYLNSQISE